MHDIDGRLDKFNEKLDHTIAAIGIGEKLDRIDAKLDRLLKAVEGDSAADQKHVDDLADKLNATSQGS